MGAFKRSWEIAKMSIGIIRQDKEMLVFPILSIVFSLLFIVLLIVPITYIKELLQEPNTILVYALIYVVYLGLAFIATFFNICAVYTTKTRFEGGNATFMDSIRFAMSRFHLIFMWSLLTSSVGVVIKIIEGLAEKVPFGETITRLIASLFEMAWAIVTIFVVPAMVYHNLGPMNAIRKSAQNLRKTWGENLIRHFGFGLMIAIFAVFGVVLFFVLVTVFSPILRDDGIVAAIAFLVSLVYLIGVMTFFPLLDAIFKTALYVYAETGNVPKGFDSQVIANAFTVKQG